MKLLFIKVRQTHYWSNISTSFLWQKAVVYLSHCAVKRLIFLGYYPMAIVLLEQN